MNFRYLRRTQNPVKHLRWCLTVLAKNSILDAWQNSEYGSDVALIFQSFNLRQVIDMNMIILMEVEIYDQFLKFCLTGWFQCLNRCKMHLIWLPHMLYFFICRKVKSYLRGMYRVRVLTQCWFCVLCHFQLKNGDDHPISTTVLSPFHKLLSIHYP